MKLMNGELKKVVEQVKAAQARINELLQNQDWMDEARKYAEQQGHEVKKLFAEDVTKLKQFLEAERREMDRFQKQIPGEVQKFKNFLKNQRKEFQKLVDQIRSSGLPQGRVLRSQSRSKTRATGTKTAGTRNTAQSRVKPHAKSPSRTASSRRSAPRKKASNATSQTSAHT